VLVERYATLGGVCLNVGCIPSKALLHVAAVMDEVKHFAALGVDFGPPAGRRREAAGAQEQGGRQAHRRPGAMAKMRKVTVVRGYGSFADPHHVWSRRPPAMDRTRPASTQTIRFKQCIIAAGSQAVRLPFLPDDPRIVDSTGALQLRQMPKRMLVIGGGIIGLEMGTVYSTLGARLDVVEMLDGLMQGADRDLVKVWEKINKPRFDRVMLKTKTVGAEATADGIRVQFEGLDGSRSEGLYDLVLQAVGRSPNGRKIGADKAGVTVNERGFIPVDVQMRTNVPHIFAIGDVVGQPMLAHKAVHEAHVAAEVAAGTGRRKLRKARFDARVIPSVAYTDPEVAWVGLTEDEAKAKGIASRRGCSRGRLRAAPSPTAATRASPSCCSTRDAPHPGRRHRRHACRRHDRRGRAGHRDGRRRVDIGKTIHPHPTLGESIGMAAEVAHGSCTDLPPARR
jgi:dihydrolipoamide dehydrogenase